jgi:hypothetical protein
MSSSATALALQHRLKGHFREKSAEPAVRDYNCERLKVFKRYAGQSQPGNLAVLPDPDSV